MTKTQHKFKCVILGDSNTGKSSIIRRITNHYTNNITSTIGAEYVCKTIETDEHIITYELWDTAGQERFESILPMYYRNAIIAIIVYDITTISTHNKVIELYNKVNDMNNNSTMIFFIGNKLDLAYHHDTKLVDDFAKKNNIIHIKTSAKENTNINNVLETINNLIMNSHYFINVPKNDDVIILNSIETKSSCFTTYFKHYFSK